MSVRTIRTTVVIALAACLALATASCGGGNMRAEIDRTRAEHAKIAVISVTVNDYGKALQGTSNSDVAELITRKMNEMLAFAETELGKIWSVVPATNFVGSEAYKRLSIGDLFPGVYGPVLDGHPMLSFSASRGDLVKTDLDPTVAADLCQALGVDLIALVYSEWATKTGGFIPVTKPLTKNVMGIFDSQGRRIFKDRKDNVGRKTLGAFGRAVVDEDTINQWVGSYEDGMTRILGEI